MNYCGIKIFIHTKYVIIHIMHRSILFLGGVLLSIIAAFLSENIANQKYFYDLKHVIIFAS